MPDINIEDLKELRRIFNVISLMDDEMNKDIECHLTALGYHAYMPADTPIGNRIFIGWASDYQSAGSWVEKRNDEWYVEIADETVPSLEEAVYKVFS